MEQESFLWCQLNNLGQAQRSCFQNFYLQEESNFYSKQFSLFISLHWG